MSDDLKSLFALIETGSERAMDLIASILKYSMVGRDEVEISTINLKKLLDEISSFVVIPEGFRLQYDEHMPTITGSHIQLNEVLTNLIGNAIKYHDKDSGSVRITCELLADNEIKIQVIDDGPGIKEKYQKSIFNLFESINETKRADSTGVGLAIVKKLVEQSGGKVGLSSIYGEGSVFWFTWPVDLRKVNLD